MVEIPDLDDREFEELFAEARRELPVKTDDWTDHNAHDSGIAILEMLTWLADTYTYQLNRITDAHREKYLRLLGVERTPPQPARAQVVVDPPAGATGETVPAGERLTVEDGSGETKTFETATETTLTAASIAKVITYDGGDIINTTAEAKAESTAFQAFGDDTAVDDALYIGFDEDPFADARQLRLSIDLYDDDLPAPATHGDLPSTFEPSVELSWEYLTQYTDWETDDNWEPFTVLEDGTDSLYDDGHVVLEQPVNWREHQTHHDTVGLLEQEPGLLWVRCRIDRSGYEIPPQLDTIRLNVLDVSHRSTHGEEILDRGDGTLETTYESNQEFYFEHAPVLDAEIEIAGESWTAVDDLDRSGSLDKHYVLDHTRGAITFGDGENGRKPPVREHVIATQYVHGGGTKGNVSANSEWLFDREDGELGDVPLAEIPLSPSDSATGGTDRESIPEAFDRFKRDFKLPYRAATLDDYAYLATNTPGLRFGRAHATTKPHQLDGSATEQALDDAAFREIEVVVVPYSPQIRPTPSEGFVAAVEDHLERTRLVTDTVTVRGPEYVTLDIDMTISALSGYTDAELTTVITDKLVTHFHPIEAGGWPFGQPLYVSELTEVVEDLPGVGAVESVTVTAAGEERINEYGDVLIDESALFALGERNIQISVMG